MKSNLISELRQYERMQKLIFEGAEESANDVESIHVPVGRCSKHPNQVTGNGQFDSPCPICEFENDAQ